MGLMATLRTGILQVVSSPQQQSVAEVAVVAGAALAFASVAAGLGAGALSSAACEAETKVNSDKVKQARNVFIFDSGLTNCHFLYS